MNLMSKEMSPYLYSLIISILIIAIYKFTNRNKKNDKNGKYIILFLVLFVTIFFILSYFILKKNYLMMPIEGKKQKGGGNNPVYKSNPNIEVDADLPNF